MSDAIVEVTMDAPIKIEDAHLYAQVPIEFDIRPAGLNTEIEMKTTTCFDEEGCLVAIIVRGYGYKDGEKITQLNLLTHRDPWSVAIASEVITLLSGRDFRKEVDSHIVHHYRILDSPQDAQKENLTPPPPTKPVVVTPDIFRRRIGDRRNRKGKSRGG